MVHVVESVDVVHGAREEATEYFKKFAGWINANGGVSHVTRLTTPSSGQSTKLFLTYDCDSMSAFGELYQESRADAKLMATVREAFVETKCIVPGTFSRNIYEEV